MSQLDRVLFSAYDLIFLRISEDIFYGVVREFGESIAMGECVNIKAILLVQNRDMKRIRTPECTSTRLVYTSIYATSTHVYSSYFMPTVHIKALFRVDK